MSRKKRNKYYLKEKQLIRLRMKDSEIHSSIKNQGWVELEEPIHHGYNAEWILRDDILRRADAIHFQEALSVCNSRIWSKTPEFRYKDKKTKQWVLKKPELKKINKDTYEKLSPTAKKFFVEDTSKDRRYWRYGYTDKLYQCTLSYELVMNITKSFITHQQEHNSVLYQMDAENEKMMYIVAGNDNPWGYGNGRGKWWKKHEDRKAKLAAERRVIEVIKAYKTITKKKDLLDL